MWIEGILATTTPLAFLGLAKAMQEEREEEARAAAAQSAARPAVPAPHPAAAPPQVAAAPVAIPQAIAEPVAPAEFDPHTRQLAALDQAIAAGVFTPEEGEARRRALLASPQPMDAEAIARRRAAIHAALLAGVLEPHEADAKLAALPPSPLPAQPESSVHTHPPQNSLSSNASGTRQADEIHEPPTNHDPMPQAGAPAPMPPAQAAPIAMGTPSSSQTAPLAAAPGFTEIGDPLGRFRLLLPPGWRADSEANMLKLTMGDAWARFETSSEQGSAVEVAQRHAEKMRPFYVNWRVVNGGPFQTRRQRPAGGWTIIANWSGNTGQREAVLLVWSLSAGGDRFLTMTSSADSAVAQQANAGLMGIFDSVRFAGE